MQIKQIVIDIFQVDSEIKFEYLKRLLGLLKT